MSVNDLSMKEATKKDDFQSGAIVFVLLVGLLLAVLYTSKAEPTDEPPTHSVSTK